MSAGRELLLSPGELRLHPQTERVPELEAKAYRELRADITERGLLCALEITDGRRVLDGRARLRAARELGLEQVPVRIIAPADESEHVLLSALRRRHLSASQRAALALELAQVREAREAARGRQRANLRGSTEVANLPPRGEKTRELGARIAGVSARTVQDAATVLAKDPELFAQIKEGRVKASDAARRLRRAERDAALGEPPPLPTGPFELILADPPWQLGSPDSNRAPENHYPTMPLEEIAALEVPAAEHAICFLWAVSCLLPQALEVLSVWGFRYRTQQVWIKDKLGMGHWVRHRHEPLLIGTRGRFSPPDPADVPDSVIEAPRGRHSEKPVCVYEQLERAYPAASKLELFARRARPGWACWGNETPAAEGK